MKVGDRRSPPREPLIPYARPKKIRPGPPVRPRRARLLSRPLDLRLGALDRHSGPLSVRHSSLPSLRNCEGERQHEPAAQGQTKQKRKPQPAQVSIRDCRAGDVA